MKTTLLFLLGCLLMVAGCRVHPLQNKPFGGDWAGQTDCKSIQATPQAGTDTSAESGAEAWVPRLAASPLTKPLIAEYQARKEAFGQKISRHPVIASHIKKAFAPKQILKKKAAKPAGSSGGGGGLAIIGILLLLYVLFRKIGLSAGWSWGIVLGLLAVILLAMWLAYGQ